MTPHPRQGSSGTRSSAQVSRGFAVLTGYSVEFSTGRSCRFLQPDSRVVNDRVNGEERKLLYDFCIEATPGTNIVNLLLNETYDGKRFWNLLRMTCVKLDTGEVFQTLSA